MDDKLYKAIDSITINNTEKMDSLAASIKLRSYEQPRELISMIHNQEEKEDNITKARMLLQTIGDCALTPFLDSLDPDNPDDLLFDLEAAVTLHRQNQSRIVANLEKLLSDKRALPPQSALLEAEEESPPKRVCDEAYVLMRELLAGEDEESSMVNTRMFIYGMEEKERDEEIERLQKSKEWIVLTELSRNIIEDD